MGKSKTMENKSPPVVVNNPKREVKMSNCWKFFASLKAAMAGSSISASISKAPTIFMATPIDKPVKNKRPFLILLAGIPNHSAYSES